MRAGQELEELSVWRMERIIIGTTAILGRLFRMTRQALNECTSRKLESCLCRSSIASFPCFGLSSGFEHPRLDEAHASFACKKCAAAVSCLFLSKEPHDDPDESW